MAVGIALALAFPRQVLCLDSGPVQADAIVVLGGGAYERPARAAELFKAHAAPKIIVSGAGDCSGNRNLLLKEGVPDDAIVLEPKSRTTRENAQLTIPLLRSAGAKRVIVVTSWYHSRRALRVFQHYAPDLKFFSRPSYYAYERAAWTREGLKPHLRAEYPKLLGYWICYGVCPF